MQYAYYSLRPRTGLSLRVQKSDGSEVKYDVPSKITHGKQVIDLTGGSDAGFDIWEYERKAEDAYKRATRQYIYDKLPGVFIWRIPSFEIDPAEVDTIVDRAKKFPAMIIDLRGNSGGRVDMLRRLIGDLFPNDVKVGDEKKRKETKEIIAKTRGDKSYEGKITVLIDSRSASASEVFSRVIQLQKRGTIVGDRSAGAVMESISLSHDVGMDTVVTFATSMTVADLIMTDGKSLEKSGVSPDIWLLPTGQEMAAGLDPVLAKAVELSGQKMPPDLAGKIFYQTDLQGR
jgi:C-terminal processing protease CtpA/Prc